MLGLSHSLLVSTRPLHLAARNGLATVVQALLSRGATVLAVDEEGESFSCLVGSFQHLLSGYRYSRMIKYVNLLFLTQATPQPWPVLPTRTWLTAWL